ncbi:MAG: Vibrio phage [Pseudomonadota bacterium]|jgi:hypothetical protein
MATRSVISKYYEQENCFKSVYCHWDGYPEGVGKTLEENYQDEDKINRLIEEGGISVLSETVEGTTFYIRDFGEEKNGLEILISETNDLGNALADILKFYTWSEYIYIFYKNQWLVYKVKFGKRRNTANQITV